MILLKKVNLLKWAFGVLISFVIAGSVVAQPIEISGQVIAASDGEPLAGVNIRVEGSTTGTTTDGDGNYSLSANSSDTLAFSFVGFQDQQVPIDGRNTINVRLGEGNVALDELVVTGYGTVNQQQSTSSITEVNEEQLGKVTASDANSVIQGKVAGVYISDDTGEPGSTPSIRIRGTGSLSAGSDPLYVIDGVISGTGMEGVSPTDIASISVLKDAAATALYGSRASSGVVVISTKSGSSGQTQVNVRSTVGFSRQLRGNLDLMNSQQLYNLHEAMGDPNLTPELLNTNTNWQDVLYRTGMTSRYDASVSGGDEKTRFYISGNYFQQEGTVLNTHFDELSGRANLTHDVNDDFQVTARVAGSYSTQENTVAGANYNLLNFSYRLLPWDKPYKDDGSLFTGQESDWLSRDSENPLYPTQWNYNEGQETYFSGNLKLEYDFTNWLYLTTTNRFDLSNTDSEIYYDRRSQIGSTNNGELYNEDIRNSSFISSNLLHIDKDLDNHTIGGVAGVEYQRNDYQSLNSRGIGIPIGLTVQDVAAEALDTGGLKEKSIFASVLAQVNYSFRNTYNLSASFRRDGSSRFGEDNRYGNFYSFSGSWLISNEAFMNSFSEVDQLKVRASYGTTGNAEIGSYEAYGLYSYANQYGGEIASVPVRIPSPNLSWEIAYNTNIGFDIGLFNRLDVTLDLYNKRNQDLLQQVRQPGTSGYEYRIRNVGTIRNRGVEIAVSSQNIQGTFRWTTDFNIGFNKNEVIELNEGRPILNGNQRIIEGRELSTWFLRKWAGVDPENGDPLWERQILDEQGNITDTELTNNYDQATLQPVGTASPNFTGGIRNLFQYKNLSLSTFFNFVSGNKIYYSEGYDDGAYVGINNAVLQDDESRWEEPGDNATHPRPVYGGNQDSHRPSSRWLVDGSFIRLKNATLSYNLPTNLLQKVNIRSLRLYVSGDNLFTFTDYRGRDPEVNINAGVIGENTSTGPTNAGTIGEKYPSSRKILFGIELGL